jgi:hypothetical protein
VFADAAPGVLPQHRPNLSQRRRPVVPWHHPQQFPDSRGIVEDFVEVFEGEVAEPLTSGVLVVRVVSLGCAAHDGTVLESTSVTFDWMCEF